MYRISRVKNYADETFFLIEKRNWFVWKKIHSYNTFIDAKRMLNQIIEQRDIRRLRKIKSKEVVWEE